MLLDKVSCCGLDTETLTSFSGLPPKLQLPPLFGIMLYCQSVISSSGDDWNIGGGVWPRHSVSEPHDV